VGARLWTPSTLTPVVDGGGGEGTMARGGGVACITPGEGEGARPSRRRGGAAICTIGDWGVSRGGKTRQNRAPHAAVDAYATVLISSRDRRGTLLNL
jgi:hypothetical protein